MRYNLPELIINKPFMYEGEIYIIDFLETDHYCISIRCTAYESRYYCNFDQVGKKLVFRKYFFGKRVTVTFPISKITALINEYSTNKLIKN